MKYKHYLLIALSVLTLFSDAVQAGKKVFTDLPETPLGSYGVRYVPPRDVPLPHSHSLPHLSVANQGPIGTCAIFTAAGCFEEHNRGVRVSEAEFAVFAETQIDDCVAGINLGRTLQLAQNSGVVSDAWLPYVPYISYVARENGVDPYNPRAADVLRENANARICQIASRIGRDGRIHVDRAASYDETMGAMGSELTLASRPIHVVGRLGDLYPLHHVSKDSLQQTFRWNYWVSLGIPSAPVELPEETIGAPANADIDSIKHALSLGMPVAVAAGVYDNCWLPTADVNYKIKMPVAGDALQGSHAFMLTGYDDAQESFILRNSWGAGWGRGGYARLPYDYLKYYATEVIAVGK